jgi:multidrug efflux pump subunit AcrA (membrane-fusion protein)
MAQAELKVSAAQVTESDLRLNQATVRSPVSGLVVERNARTGMLLAQNSEPLFMVLRDDDLEVELEVSADDAPRLKLGMPVSIQLMGDVAQASKNTSSLNASQQDSNQLDAVKARITAWAQAWQTKDAAAYLASYSEQFVPEQKISRETWIAQRKKRLATKDQLQLALSQINVQIKGDKVSAEFVQHYSANGKKEDVNKRLIFVREGKDWLITHEQVIGQLDTLQAERASGNTPAENVQASASFNGKVSRAATEINRQNQIAKVRVRFNQTPNLILGQFARVTVKSMSSQAIYLPDTAVRFDGVAAYVFTAQQGLAKRMPVKIGQHIGSKLEILEGLPVGTLVIDSAASFLRDGEAVRLVTTGQSATKANKVQ